MKQTAQDANTSLNSGRIRGVDGARTVAILAVISIHTEPFRRLAENDGLLSLLGILLNHGARFAVPFFFIASGYFFQKKLDPDGWNLRLFRKSASRLIFLFLIWSLIYLVVPSSPGELLREGPAQATYNHITRVLADLSPLDLVMQGTKVHLWFIVALLMAFLIAVLFYRGATRWFLYPFALALYIFGLLAGSYAATPIGLEIGFNTRNGPFFSTLFVIIGIWLAKGRLRTGTATAVLIAASGFLLQVAEAALLWRTYGVEPWGHDFLIGTVPFSAGVMLLALSRRDSGGPSFLTAPGQYVLGIYLSHFLLIELLHPLNKFIQGPAWEVLFPAIVFVSSCLLVIFLSRIPYLRRIVT